jgi:hypothetical protein
MTDSLARLYIPVLVLGLLIVRQVKHGNFRAQTPTIDQHAFPLEFIYDSTTHVAVSCVFMQVSTRPFPTKKSSISRLSSFFQSTALRPPSVTPRIKLPPRKHTRWSCLGTTCHPLRLLALTDWGSAWQRVGTQSNTHCSCDFGIRVGTSS